MECNTVSEVGASTLEAAAAIRSALSEAVENRSEPTDEDYLAAGRAALTATGWPDLLAALLPFASVPLDHTSDIDDSALIYQYDGGELTLGDFRRVHAAIRQSHRHNGRVEKIHRL